MNTPRHTFSHALVALLVSAGSLALPPRLLGENATEGFGEPQSIRRQLSAFRRSIRDLDHDGLPDVVEQALGTNPRRADSDDNGIWDGDEPLLNSGMTRLEAYDAAAVAYSHDDGEDDDDDGDDDHDEDRRSGVNSGRARPKVCGAKVTRNCRAPICSKSRAQRQKKLCRPRPQNPKPTPSASPSVSPSPTTSATPRPSSTPASGNFDANGNTTAFGIPAGLVGNKNAGSSVWTSKCSGCHSTEERNRTFPQIQGALSIPVMSGIQITDAQLANLVAYLNRFNL